MSDLIVKLWQQQPGEYFFLASKKGASFETYAIKRKDIKRRVPEIIGEEADYKNMYFCPHGFSAPRRVKENAVLPNLLYADLDEADPRTMKPRPTIALESSPGRFVGFWKTDKAITEELNQRLTNHVGADKAGYDLTQVLRVPGTFNFKYASRPRVKTLWDDGPEYTIAGIEKLLPKVKGVKPIMKEAWDVWKEFRLKSLELANLIESEDPPADRSGAQWGSYSRMAKLGMTADQIEIVWRAVIWGKGSDYDEDKKPGWLRKDIDRSLGEGEYNGFDYGKNKSNGDYAKDAKVVDDLWDNKTKLADGFFNMKDVTPEEYEWIFHPFFAKGEMTLVQGDPKCGKSYSLQMIGLRIARGFSFNRYSERKCETVKGKVIYFDPENDPSKITAKRLAWNGFNPAKHDNFYVQAYSSSIGSEEFREYVYGLMNKHKPAMVIFDTLLHFSLGDANSNSDMTQVMGWFARLARQYDCSVVVVRHMKKSSGRDAMTSGSGATSIAGVTRLVVTVGYHPDDPDIRVITSTKGSMTSNKLKVPAFRIESIENGDPDQSKFVWENELYEMDADAMVAQNMKSVSAKEDGKKPMWQKCADVLFERMIGGKAVLRPKLEDACKEAGLDFSDGQFRKALSELGLRSVRQTSDAEGRFLVEVEFPEKLADYKKRLRATSGH